MQRRAVAIGADREPLGVASMLRISVSMRKSTTCLTLLLVAGCGAPDTIDLAPEPSPPPPAPVRWRLVAAGYDGGDGAFIERGIYDRQLGVECAPTRAEDDSIRCMPRRNGIVRYLDTECQRPVLEVHEHLDTPRFVDDFVFPERLAPRFVYRVGDRIEDGTRYALVDGECLRVFEKDEVPTDQPGLTDPRDTERWPIEGSTFALTRMAPDDFEPLVLDERPVGEGVVVRFVSDRFGTRFDLRLFSVEGRESCGVSEVSGGLRCEPKFSVGGSVLNTCVSQGIIAVGSWFEPPTFLWTPPAEECGERQLIRRTQTVDVASLRGTRFEDVCPLEDDLTYTHYEHVDVSELPVLPLISGGSERLEVRKPVNTWAEAKFYDRELGVACSPTEFAGELRCVPKNQGRFEADLHLDDTCATPIGIVTSYGSKPRYVLDWQGSALIEVGDPVVPEEWHTRVDGECVPLVRGAAPCAQYFAVRARLAPNHLAPLVRTHR